MNTESMVNVDLDTVNDFVSDNWDYYKEWLSEYIGYAGGLDWDTAETRMVFYVEQVVVYGK